MADDYWDKVREFHKEQERVAKNKAIFEGEIIEAIEKEGGLWGKIMAPVARFFAVSFEYVWSGFRTVFAPFLDVIFGFFGLGWFKLSEGEWRNFWSWFQANGLLDTDDIQALWGVYDSWKTGAGLWMRVVGLFLQAKALFAWGDVLGGTIIQNLNKKYSPVVPSPESIARVSFLAPELHGKVVNAMKRAGLSPEDIKLMFLSNYALYGIGEIKDMYFRGVLTEDAANNRMAEMGFTETRIAELKKIWERIPSLADIIHYLAKEAFEPDMIETFGLMSEYPGEAEKWAAMHGLDAKWVQAEWVSHWRDLGINFMLTALHRGITDWDTVEKYMRLIEIPPKLREIVRDTAYHPYTRVDVRRMHKTGILDDAQLLQSYMDLGFDLEKATSMADFTIKYNMGEEQTAIKKFITEGYRRGSMTWDEALRELMDVGYNERMALSFLWAARYEEILEQQDIEVENIKLRYQSNQIDRREAKQLLDNMNLPATQTDNYLLKWEKGVQSEYKFPSKTDLDKFLKADIIREVQYKSEMVRLGYNDTYISWYLELHKTAK